jgi:glycosyltransferase involved in cell wall biosynthesis
LRILATVERYAPAIGGAERVVQRVAEGLAARGHELHILTGGGGGHTELGGVNVHRVAVSGNEARGITGERDAVIGVIESVAPEVVFNYAAQTWATDCCFPLLERSRRPRMVLAPCGFSGLGKRRYRAYFQAMPERLRRYDALILHSAVYQDWRFARSAGAEQIEIVPNGADPPAERRYPAGQHPGGQLAVTVGSHVVSKGHAAFARAIRSLARDRELSGSIVAPARHGLDALRGCQLSCRVRARRRTLRLIDGSAPEAVTRAIADADLFLFTSRVECAPLVILEAMAAGTPWVSFDVGNVSELAGGVVALSPRELLQICGEILDGQRPQLGAEGRAAWEANHRWPNIVARYESVFEEVLSAPVAPA